MNRDVTCPRSTCPFLVSAHTYVCTYILSQTEACMLHFPCSLPPDRHSGFLSNPQARCNEDLLTNRITSLEAQLQLCFQVGTIQNDIGPAPKERFQKDCAFCFTVQQGCFHGVKSTAFSCSYVMLWFSMCTGSLCYVYLCVVSL